MMKVMKIGAIFGVAACAFSAFAANQSSTCPGVGVNLVKNPSFEEWKEGAPLPDGWTSPNRQTLTNKVFRSTDIVADGKNAVRFTNARCGNMLQQRIKVTPGKYYDLSCMARTRINYMEFRLGNHWETRGGKYVHNVTKLAAPPHAMGKTEWHPIVVKNLRAPDGVDRLVIDLIPNDSHSGNDVPGDIWVDKVCVTESDVAVADEGDSRVFATVPILDDAVAVDGTDDDPAWRSASVLSRFVSPRIYSPEGAQTAVKVVADRKGICIFARCDRLPSTTRPHKKTARDAAETTDVIEFYLKPDPSKDLQYHFMADGAGNLYDSTQSYCTNAILPKGQFIRAKHNKKWDCAGLEWVAKDNDSHWTFECRVPYASVGIGRPADGDRMLVNFARADYGEKGVNHEQITQWTLQDALDFADWRDWGAVAFVRGGPAVRRVEIEPGSRAVAAEVAATERPAAVRVVVEEISADGVKVKLGEASASVAAGESASLRIPLANRCDLTWVSVYDGDRLVYRRGGRPAGKSLKICQRDPCNVRKNKIFIPNDANWPNVFIIQHTLTGQKGCKVYGNPTNLNAHIWCETPPGVFVDKMMYSSYGAEMPVLKPISERQFDLNGEKWTRYELPVFISGVNCPHVFLRSTLPAGATGDVRLYMTWDGGEQMPNVFNFKVVSIGRVKPFERLYLRMDDLRTTYAYALVDDPAKELPELGMNVWKIPLYPSKMPKRIPGTAETGPDRLDRLVREMKASGLTWYFSVQNELNDSLRFWCNKETWGNPLKLTPDPEACFCDIKGRPKKNTWGWVTICPSYRGTNFLAQVKGVLESEAVRKYGVSWFVIDWEFWGQDPCYCDRCLRLWDAFRREHGLADIGSPREFMQDEAAHPEHAKAYRELYWRHRGGIYRDFREALNKGCDKNRTEWHSPKKGCFMLSEWAAPKPHLLPGIDVFDWSVGYHEPGSRLGRVREVYENVINGDSSRIAWSMTSMQSSEMSTLDPPISGYYNMMEAATAGVRGFEFWWSPVFEAETWKYVMDGLRMIRPFEDIVLDGKVTIHEDGEGCAVRHVDLGDEALYCVRDYELKEPKRVAFTLRAKAEGDLVDLETGKAVLKLRAGENRIELDISPARLARFLYAGPNYARRIADVEK